ncbi:unnamed protein product [Fusarium graminearum]|uniref:Chromosome 1, complete genome n=2 Tax=Gibberella zeae TaxID=5518 RepID=I1RES6_GIBZE|nr:hypothetical protein FGSG_02177 [Fusarium graminearum PH-1]EYB26033.1 hypothetical protein FG05_02177 [Fusarium graminearum]ESU07578.1 hypothetical protein FGSG_02177 [Fusarium graminearum PH-1]KAI6771178.1 hypothetical protein HG531_010033 [Fusarium graminearum]PCD39185.1 hypothetical protein FGRA07_00456 [Fusarium graminearum]CAF3510638.1 unnamed protein product [Fusarium graminearum]|eukprot:XP_011318063.1 hypothetical protein FGSG_02177 [Fusarium graminearum PH-1]
MSHSTPQQVSGGTDHQAQERDEITIRHRAQFRIQTHRFLQNITQLVQDWKSQAKTDFFKNLEMRGKVEGSALTTEEYVELCGAMIENRELIISSMKRGNEVFEKEIENLKSDPVEAMSDLTTERYEACVETRNQVIADLEKERLELVNKKNESDESEYPEHWIFKS